MTEPRGRRKNNKPWKHIYGVDRRYTARIDRLRQREPGQSAPHLGLRNPEGNLVDAGIAEGGD